jgi:hypothetical protein
VLVVFAVAAVTAAIVVATSGGRSGGADGPAWSRFTPSSDGLDTGAREIADYVGRQYRLPSGRQIVAVTGGPLELRGLPMHLAVRESPADGGEINLVDGRGVLYRLCGLGAKCAIASGKATPERSLLLQREALELALYSFHDLDDVDNVVVFMPPDNGRARRSRCTSGEATSPASSRARRRPRYRRPSPPRTRSTDPRAPRSYSA